MSSFIAAFFSAFWEKETIDRHLVLELVVQPQYQFFNQISAVINDLFSNDRGNPGKVEWTYSRSVITPHIKTISFLLSSSLTRNCIIMFGSVKP
jgi:hypothetical protein